LFLDKATGRASRHYVGLLIYSRVGRWNFTTSRPQNRRPLGVEPFERGQIGAALIDGNRFGLAVLVNRPLEVAARSGLVTVGAQQEINRIAPLVDGAVQEFPLAFDLDVGFVHPPALANRSLVPSKSLFEQRHELDDPAVHARMIHLDAPFGHHFFEVAQAQRVRDIPAHAQSDDIQRIMKPLAHLGNASRQRLARRILRLGHLVCHWRSNAKSNLGP
jgi:hypothetical protein